MRSDPGKNRSLYILIGYVAAVALFYVALEWRSGGSSFDFFDNDEYTFREDFIPITWDIPIPEEEIPEIPVPEQPAVEVESKPVTANSNIKVIGDSSFEETEETSAVIDSIYDSLAHNGDMNSSAGSSTEETGINKDEVDRMPEFPGGIKALRRYLNRNLIYPEDALKKRTEGTVLCTFIITERGRITDVKILQGQNPEMDAEALRVISQMPSWHAGIQKGKQIAVRYVMPIVFALTIP